MKLKVIAANQNEIETSKGTIFFSYNTPVAAHIKGVFYRTSKFWSVTTTKHINRWLGDASATEKPQEFFDVLT